MQVSRINPVRSDCTACNFLLLLLHYHDLLRVLRGRPQHGHLAPGSFMNTSHIVHLLYPCLYAESFPPPIVSYLVHSPLQLDTNTQYFVNPSSYHLSTICNHLQSQDRYYNCKFKQHMRSCQAPGRMCQAILLPASMLL